MAVQISFRQMHLYFRKILQAMNSRMLPLFSASTTYSPLKVTTVKI